MKEFLTCLVKDCDTIMMAYGQGSVKQNGIYDEVLGILMKNGKKIVEFPDIMPNPTYKKVLEGAELAKKNHVQMILGIGGGSVMDCAKAVSLAAGFDGDAWENFWARRGIIDFEMIPVGVIPTTADTGSECNGAAVITNEEEKVKTGYDYPKCNPRFALMDPSYTFSVPETQMVSGAFDSLSHMMETYFSEPDEQNVSDEITEALMRNVIRNLRQAVQDPKDYSARSNLFWDSTLSENRLIKLGKKREELAEAGIDALVEFIREVGLPTSLRELGIKNDKKLKDIAESCHYSPGGYRKLEKDEVLEIFRECY